MNNLNNAISLYQDNDRVKALKIDYLLAEDRRKKQAIRITLLNLGHRIKDK